jgi:phosphate uptake regulator
MVENPATISSVAQLMFVARNIERIGDHATNIAEMVHYAATALICPSARTFRHPPDTTCAGFRSRLEFRRNVQKAGEFVTTL